MPMLNSNDRQITQRSVGRFTPLTLAALVVYGELMGEKVDVVGEVLLVVVTTPGVGMGDVVTTVVDVGCEAVEIVGDVVVGDGVTVGVGGVVGEGVVVVLAAGAVVGVVVACAGAGGAGDLLQKLTNVDNDGRRSVTGPLIGVGLCLEMQFPQLV